jgi:hypothetical protein
MGAREEAVLETKQCICGVVLSAKVWGAELEGALRIWCGANMSKTE